MPAERVSTVTSSAPPMTLDWLPAILAKHRCRVRYVVTGILIEAVAQSDADRLACAAEVELQAGKLPHGMRVEITVEPDYRLFVFNGATYQVEAQAKYATVGESIVRINGRLDTHAGFASPVTENDALERHAIYPATRI